MQLEPKTPLAFNNLEPFYPTTCQGLYLFIRGVASDSLRSKILQIRFFSAVDFRANDPEMAGWQE